MNVYSPQRTSDEAINRNLDAIALQLRQVAAVLAGFGIGGGLVSFPTAAFIVDGEAMVSWGGAAAATGTLPGAASLGPRVMRELTVVNTGTATVTMAPGSGDSISGTTTVTSGSKSIWRSDGVSKWFRVV